MQYAPTLKQSWEWPLLILTILFYFIFGTYHLAQFETTDEHFWKYERIPQYWEALKEGNLKKTAINDKPGITVALTSGIGLLFSDPENHRIRDSITTQDGALTVYDASATPHINWSLRFPILFLNGLLILASFFLLKKIFPQGSIPLTTTIFIALSPVLIGISQIINPDALLWSFSWMSLLAVLVFLRTTRWFYLLLASIATGLALLSKYTANILFPLELTLLLSYPFFNPDWANQFPTLRHYLQRIIWSFLTIILLASITFALGLPAVFKKPEKLWDGLFGFWHSMHIDWFIIGVLLILILDGFLLGGRFFTRLLTSWKSLFQSWLHWLLLLPLIFYGSVFLLSLSNQSLLPLNTLLSTAKENGDLAFPLLDQYPAALAPIIKLFVAAYPFVVSIHPLLWLLLFLGWILMIRRSLSPLSIWLTICCSWFSLAYFAAALGAGVLTNVRYSIILYPLFALMIALAIHSLLSSLPSRFSRYTPLLFLSLFILLSISLFTTKPFYLNYTSPLVSSTVSPHDAWGYGQYEAAQFLNNLPKQDQLLIWSDRNGICQFLTGPKCISGYKIDLSKTRPDYFVISKRGTERNYVPRDTITAAPLFDFNELVPLSLWRLNILDRPANFILIAPNPY